MSIDETESRERERLWRVQRSRLWARVILEAIAWFTAVLILHWLVRLATT